jgi:hypothetical protein
VSPDSRDVRVEREVAARRRRQRLLFMALALGGIFLIVSVSLAVFALSAKQEAEKQRQDAVFARTLAEEQKQNALAANLELEAKDREIRSLIEESARSDRLVAEEKLGRGEDGEALAYLSRATRYVPNSSLSAEAAIRVVLSPSIQHSRTSFEGHSRFTTQTVDRSFTVAD